ncbi:MAG: lipoyl(octanoyl) transferase [Euryarchaeota archaeon RBG_16_68_12]|nr:MAG: lipoyl(octanoyl) transferase [Euryarchaeota archaeon RBG_16_68_12]
MTAWFVDLGTVEYREAWDLQRALVERRAADAIPDTLLLLEHPHVVTLGRRGRREDVFDPSLPVFEIERGGEATYHGPGQLVGYPILKLQDRLDVRKLVMDLEEVLIRSSRAFGITAERNERQHGVWVHGRKLGSIGLAVHRNVTYHGFAHNVNTDLSYFQRIRPCGNEGRVMTSMEKELGRAVDLTAFKARVAQDFVEVFAEPLEAAPAAVLISTAPALPHP